MPAESARPANRLQNSLYVCQFGEEACLPGHFYGPHIREHHLIHFVLSGSGILQCGEQVHRIGAGQGFLILPGEETFYQADARDPWHYAWVGYQGSLADEVTRQAGLDALHRVFTAAEPEKAWQVLSDMREEARRLAFTQGASIGNLLRFISYIDPAQVPPVNATAARQYCEKAQWYLEGRYDQDVSIQETADFVGLSRSQLYRVMMAELGCSPKALLGQIRMRHARELLSTTDLTREAIAHRIGLQTGAQLGAMFRAREGVAPQQYRERARKHP